MQEIVIRRDEHTQRVYVTLSVSGTSAEIEGQGDTLHEALFDLAELVENEVER